MRIHTPTSVINLKTKTRLEKFIQTIFRPFVLNENPDFIEKNINLDRILVGLGIFHSYLDILGFSIFLSPEGELKAISVLALSFLFTIGLFTPFACGLLIYFLSRLSSLI